MPPVASERDRNQLPKNLRNICPELGFMEVGRHIENAESILGIFSEGKEF